MKVCCTAACASSTGATIASRAAACASSTGAMTALRRAAWNSLAGINASEAAVVAAPSAR
jgi:hypothetical protein